MTVGTSCSKWPIILIAKRSQNVAGSCSLLFIHNSKYFNFLRHEICARA